MEATAPVTVEQAAAILGVSASTVHRRIRSGALRAERAQRPQGTVWLVHLPPDTVAATGTPPPPTGAEATAPVAPEAREAMISYTRTVLEPLVTALERSQAVVREQAETIGRLTAENEALRAAGSHSPGAGHTGPQPPDLTTEPRLRLSGRVWLALLAVAGLAVWLVLMWLR